MAVIGSGLAWALTHLTAIAEGWFGSVMEAVPAGLRCPAAPTPKAERFDAPLLATKNQSPSEVIPADVGLAPTEAAAGNNALTTPLAELLLSSSTCTHAR